MSTVEGDGGGGTALTGLDADGKYVVYGQPELGFVDEVPAAGGGQFVMASALVNQGNGIGPVLRTGTVAFMDFGNTPQNVYAGPEGQASVTAEAILPSYLPSALALDASGTTAYYLGLDQGGTNPQYLMQCPLGATDATCTPLVQFGASALSNPAGSLILTASNAFWVYGDAPPRIPQSSATRWRPRPPRLPSLRSLPRSSATWRQTAQTCTGSGPRTIQSIRCRSAL